MSFIEQLHSLWNFFWFHVRKGLKFKRKGYREATTVAPRFSAEAAQVNTTYNFTSIGEKLAPQNWHRNLATLWYMEQMLGDVKFAFSLKILEPGCQNFSRLPSLRAYFDQKNIQTQITGIELDAFVPLKGFHSLWDHAQYYISLKQDGARFVAADFFKWQESVDLILCFYPFVSAAPALAWGLPASVAGAEHWIAAFCKNLKTDGHVLVVHQGDWEEKDFDRARVGKPMGLIKRAELKCPFFSTKHPARASLYKKL